MTNTNIVELALTDEQVKLLKEFMETEIEIYTELIDHVEDHKEELALFEVVLKGVTKPKLQF